MFTPFNYIRVALSLPVITMGLLAATPYDWGRKIRLNNGETTVRLVHAINGVEQGFQATFMLPLGNATYQKIVIWPTTYRTSRSETSCPSPCSLAIPMHYGSAKLRSEYFDADGNLLRTSDWYDVPQVPAAPESNVKLPVEVIGFAPFVKRLSVTLQQNADRTGEVRLYAKTHRLSYPGKGRVRINGGPWLEIQRSSVVLLGQVAHWNTPSLQFGQSVLEWTMPVTGILPGANVVEWEYAKQNMQEESGYRVLAFNFLEPNRTISSIQVLNGVATVTAASHGLQNGDDVRIENFPGRAWRLNGIKRNVTVVNPNSFSFPVSSTPNGSWSYTGVSVAKLMIDADSFTEENPVPWTPPAGGDAALGANAFSSNTLLSPSFPGEAISASCAECHAQDGRDLKYFNYSNWSISVRSQFHGLSEKAALDTAAYIRSHPSIAPGRPWNPPYQPCPNSDLVDPRSWAGACTIEDVLPHPMGMYEQLFGDTIDKSDFSPLRDDLSFRNTRIAFQLPDWNEWLPKIHPKDRWNSTRNQSLYPLGFWATSEPKSVYDTVRSNYAPHCPGSGCEAYHVGNWVVQDFYKMRSLYLTGYGGTPDGCSGSPPTTGCPTWFVTPQNQEAVGNFSAGLWANVKFWEIMQEFDLERYNRSLFPRGDGDRGWFTNQLFNMSPNLSKTPAMGIGDGSPITGTVHNAGWYQLQAVLHPLGNKCCPAGFSGIDPLDVPYQWGNVFQGFGDADSNFNILDPMLMIQWVQQNFRRHVNMTPELNGSAFWYNKAIGATSFLGGAQARLWLGIHADDREHLIRQIADAALGQWIDLASGAATNGTAPNFTPAMWYNYGGYPYPSTQYPEIPATETQPKNPLQDIWTSLLSGKAVGVSSAILDQIRDWGAANWTGPRGALSSSINAAQTSFSLESVPEYWPGGEHQIQIDGEKITCASRNGATLSSCTRGASGTASASHAAGATVQMVIRWTRARDSTCTIDYGTMATNYECGYIQP